MTTSFKKHPGANFQLDDVIKYLEELATQGWSVFSGPKPSQFVVQLDEDNDIFLKLSSDTLKGWVIQCHRRGSVKAIDWAISMIQLESAIYEQAQQLGFNVTSAPTKIRTVATKPMSNMSSVVALASNASVVSIYDSYFDDKTVSSLNTLCNLGLKMEPTVQVLTGQGMKSRLTVQAISAFNTEQNITLDIRLIKKPHRRFWILSDNSCVILGWSANSWTKDEAAHREGDGSVDIPLFSEWWAESIEL